MSLEEQEYNQLINEGKSVETKNRRLKADNRTVHLEKFSDGSCFKIIFNELGGKLTIRDIWKIEEKEFNNA